MSENWIPVSEPINRILARIREQQGERNDKN